MPCKVVRASTRNTSFSRCSREKITDVIRALPGDKSDEQSRYIEATIGDLRVASIYLPNGNPTGSEKFAYKLAWMDRLAAHAAELLLLEEPLNCSQ